MLRQKLLSWEADRKLARRQVLRFLQLSFIPSCNVLFLGPNAHFISLPKGNSPSLQRRVTCDFIGPGWAGEGVGSVPVEGFHLMPSLHHLPLPCRLLHLEPCP